MIVTLTGSQMDRALRCTAAAALPQVHNANPDQHRDRGTAKHRFLDRVGDVGHEAALAEVDEQHRAVCEAIQIAKLGDRIRLSREVALAYNWVADTARVLAPLTPRAYEIDASREVALTIDLAGVGDGVVYAGDYKGGYGWLPAPEESMQLGLAALALARLHNVYRAVVEYIRIRDDGEPYIWRAELDVLGLAGVAERVEATMADVAAMSARVSAGDVPHVVEGPWCRHCPARVHCPAKTALIRNVLASPGSNLVSYMQPLTPESARQLKDAVAKVREAIAAADAALYAYAKVTPIPVGEDEDGTKVYWGEFARPGNERLDGAITHRVLFELYGGEVANAAVTMEATKAGITNAIRPAIPAGEKISRHQERIYAAIRKRNGASRPATVSTGEFTIGPGGDPVSHKRKAR